MKYIQNKKLFTCTASPMYKRTTNIAVKAVLGARSHAHLPVRSWSATIILEVKTVSGPLRSPSISLTDFALSAGVSDRIGPQWASLSLSEVNTRSFHRPRRVTKIRADTSNHVDIFTNMENFIEIYI